MVDQIIRYHLNFKVIHPYVFKNREIVKLQVVSSCLRLSE